MLSSTERALRWFLIKDLTKELFTIQERWRNKGAVAMEEPDATNHRKMLQLWSELKEEEELDNS